MGGATSSKPPNSRGVWVFTSSLNGCTKSQCRRGPSPRVLSLLLERGGSFETGTLTLHCILRVQPRASHEPHWKSNFSFSYHLKNCFVPASLFQHAAPCWFHHCAPSIALGLLSTTRDLSEVCRSDGKTGNTSSNHEYLVFYVHHGDSLVPTTYDRKNLSASLKQGCPPNVLPIEQKTASGCIKPS